MRILLKILIIVGALGAVGAVGYRPARDYWRERNKITWETAEIESGDITRFVNSTGTVKPVLSVSIGSFVSGPIVELNVDFNDEVKKGDVLARVDPRLFKASVDRDTATLSTREADLERIEAQLQQSLNNYLRGKRLRDKNEDFLSDREMDALVFEVKSLQAQRKLAKASILQAIVDWGNSVSSEAQSLTQYNTEIARLELQTGTILQEHNVVFFEERFRSIGPLGRCGAEACYPRSQPPSASVMRYEQGTQASEEYFDLEDPVRRNKPDDADEREMKDIDPDMEVEFEKIDKNQDGEMSDEEINELLKQNNRSAFRTFSDFLRAKILR